MCAAHTKKFYSFSFSFSLQLKKANTYTNMCAFAFPRVFFMRTKYQWNRNKCWAQVARFIYPKKCAQPKKNSTIQIKGTEEKKNRMKKKKLLRIYFLFESVLYTSADSIIHSFQAVTVWCSCFFFRHFF